LYRYAAGLSLLSALALFWVNGAVGIIGSSDNDANMMYLAVLAVGGIGAFIGRFRPLGMARALSAAAAAQVTAAAIALAAGWGADSAIYPWDILAATGFFSALFFVSAWLFRKAARQEASSGKGVV
jgi:hypothetical protein